MMKHSWLLLVSLGFAQSSGALAQNCADQNQVSMLIFERGTGISISRAKVVGSSTHYADKFGRLDLCVDLFPQSFEIQKNGYASLTVNVAQPGMSRVYLVPRFDGPNVITILGRRPQEPSAVAVTAKEAASVSPGGGDPLQVTKSLPGTQQVGFRPDVAVRGSAPEDSRYYIDQIYVPFVFHRVAQISVLHARQLSEVELNRGGFSAAYGDALGGIIQVRTPQAPETKSLTELRAALPVGASAYHHRPVGKNASVSASLRRTFLDTVIPKLVEDETGLTLVPMAADAHLRYIQRQDDELVRATVLGSSDGLQLAFPDAAGDFIPTNQFEIHHAFVAGGIEWSGGVGGGVLTTTPQGFYSRNRSQISGNRVNFSIRSWRWPGSFTVRSGLNTFTLGWDLSRELHDLDYALRHFNTNETWIEAIAPPSGTFRREVADTRSALWAMHKQQVGKVAVIPSLRLFYATSIKKVGADPRLALEWVNDSHAYQLAAGQYSQTPDVLESAERFGNPSLNFERSHHFVTGWRWRVHDSFESEIQAYQKSSDSMVVRRGERRFRNDGLFRSRGMEFFLRRPPSGRVSGWLAYSFAKTEVGDHPDDDLYPSLFDQTHVVSVAALWRVSAVHEFGGRAGYHTGDTYNEIRKSIYSPADDDYHPVIEPGDRHAARLADFHQVDCHWTIHQLHPTWTMNWRLGVEFLAAKPQAYGVRYKPDYTGRDFYVGPPPIPYLEAKAIF